MQHARATWLPSWSLFAVALVLGGPLQAQAPPVSPYVVIVHPSNPVTALSRREVANLFMKRALVWADGAAVHPFDLPVSSPARASFSLSVIGREPDSVVSYWYQQVYSGRNVPPPQLQNDAAVVGAVRADPAAIGYVSPSSVTPDVRVLTVTP